MVQNGFTSASVLLHFCQHALSQHLIHYDRLADVLERLRSQVAELKVLGQTLGGCFAYIDSAAGGESADTRGQVGDRTGSRERPARADRTFKLGRADRRDA